MDVKANSLYQEMQSMIGQTRMPANELQPSNEINPSANEFSTMLKQAVDGVKNLKIYNSGLKWVISH